MFPLSQPGGGIWTNTIGLLGIRPAHKEVSMKFHTSRKSLKKLSILALALLPLGNATAASAEPVVSSPYGGFNQPIGIIYLNNQIIVGNWGNGTLQTIDPATGSVGSQV